MTLRPLRGSAREALPGARPAGKTEPNERFEVSILLKRQSSDVLGRHVARLARGERPDRPMTRQDFASQFGAHPDQIAAIRKFAARRRGNPAGPADAWHDGGRRFRRSTRARDAGLTALPVSEKKILAASGRPSAIADKLRLRYSGDSPKP